jgi:hypothetical protein
LYQNFFVLGHASRAWNLADGQTLECQVDLVRISENTTNVAELWIGDSGGNYLVTLGQDTVSLGKYVSDTTLFWWDNSVHLPRTNVVLYMALTRDKANLIITVRVLDKANQNAVLFVRSFVETPGVDPSVTTGEFRTNSGITTMTLVSDPGPPVFSGDYGYVGVFQFTDGHQPPVEAIFDNFLLRLHDEPPLNIARAVQLTWTSPAGVNYRVWAAPTVEGPWLPVQELEMPGMQKLTVPASGAAQFFRVLEGP